MSQLQDMGFEGEVARRALAKCAWDVNKALDYLVSGAAFEEDLAAERAPEVSAASRSKPPPDDVGAQGLGGWSVKRQAKDASDVRSGKHAAPPVCDLPFDGGPDRWTVEAVDAPAFASGKYAEPGHCDLQIDGGLASGIAEELLRESPSSSTRSIHQTEEPSTADPLTSPPSSRSDIDWNACSEPALPEFAPPSQLYEQIQLIEDIASQAALDIEQAAANKKVMRAATSWYGEEGEPSSSLLVVEAGELVATWPNSRSEHGWIYADSLSRKDHAGWLPIFVLQPLLAAHEKFMCAKTANETPFHFDAGSLLRVVTTSRTQEGLVFAAFVEPGQQCTDNAAPTGWIPVASLEWR
jgi:hypothetical protein